MPKTIFLLVAVFLLAAAGPARSQEGGEGAPQGQVSQVVQPQQYAPVPAFSGHANLLFGGKNLYDEPEPAWQDHGEVAIIFDMKRFDWPVSVAMEYRRSVSDNKIGIPNDGVYMDTSEFNIGVRQIIDSGGGFEVYFGGGLSFAQADLIKDATEVSVESADDIGFWAGVGTYLVLGPIFHIGADLTWSSVEVDWKPSGTSTNIGGTHFGILGGIHW